MSGTTATLIGRTGAVAGRDFVLGDQARIGAGSDAEVRIRAEGVSRLHARVWQEEGEYWIEDAGSTNGTFLGGVRIRRDRIRHLDVVTLGRAVDLIFVRRAGPAGADAVPGAAASLPRVAAAALEALDGPGGGAPIEIPKGEITLGRAASNNVVVAGRAVSKVHARIERTPGGVFIRDLDSANGTSVNGAPVYARTALVHGDRIELAAAHGFRVSIEWSGEGAGGEPVGEPPSVCDAVFSQEWRTRLVWSPEELDELAAASPEPPAPGAAASASPKRPQRPKPPARGARRPAGAPVSSAPDVSESKPSPGPAMSKAPRPAGLAAGGSLERAPAGAASGAPRQKAGGDGRVLAAAVSAETPRVAPDVAESPQPDPAAAKGPSPAGGVPAGAVDGASPAPAAEVQAATPAAPDVPHRAAPDLPEPGQSPSPTTGIRSGTLPPPEAGDEWPAVLPALPVAPELPGSRQPLAGEVEPAAPPAARQAGGDEPMSEVAVATGQPAAPPEVPASPPGPAGPKMPAPAGGVPVGAVGEAPLAPAAELPTPSAEAHAAADREAAAAFESVFAGVPLASEPSPTVRLVGAETHTLATGATVIGRSVSAAIWIDDRSVSRTHAVITVTGGEVEIEDKGSVNGTLVNDARITERTPLRVGDRVKIGDREWTVEIEHA